jgi:hypothetical protein
MRTKKSPPPKGIRHGGESNSSCQECSTRDDPSQAEPVVYRGGFPYQVTYRTVRLDRHGDLAVGLTVRGWCAEPGCGRPYDFKTTDRWFATKYQRRRCDEHKRSGVAAPRPPGAGPTAPQRVER